MYMQDISPLAFAQNLSLGINSFPLLAVPFFILSGLLMNTGGMTHRIFNFANYIVGPIRGGLGQVNIAASLVFAGMSGAAVADAAGLGVVEIKAMKDAGYDSDFSVAITAASSTIGPIIPPSIIMVIYGIAAEVSIGRLFYWRDHSWNPHDLGAWNPYLRYCQKKKLPGGKTCSLWCYR